MQYLPFVSDSMCQPSNSLIFIVISLFHNVSSCFINGTSNSIPWSIHGHRLMADHAMLLDVGQRLAKRDLWVEHQETWRSKGI
jgi:hypothetical protein